MALHWNNPGLFVAVLWILYLCIASARNAWAKIKKERSLGCQSPPWYLPWDITGWHLSNEMAKAEKSGDVNSFVRHCYDTTGSKTFMGVRGGRKTYFTIDPRVCQAVLATLFESFGVEPFRASTRDAFIGRGVLTTDGPFWKRSREELRSVFERAQIANISQFANHVDKLLEHVPLDGRTIDMQPLIVRFYLDVSTELLLGESANSLEGNDSVIDAAAFIDSFNEALAGVRKRLSRGRFNRLYEPFGRDKSWVKSCDRTRELVVKYMDAALKSKTNQNQDKNFSFTRTLAQECDNREYVRDQIVNVFFPARNSSNRGFSHIIFLLARNPLAWLKLREEALLQDLQSLTYESLKGLKYVKWVIKEGLRLYAPSPRTVRVALCDVIVPCGGGKSGEHPIYIGKGSQVAMDTACMQRDKDFWGADAA